MKRGISVLVVTFVMSVCLSLSATAQINEGFDNYQVGTRPSGWEFINCARDLDADMGHYGVAAPAVRLGRTARSRIITEEYTLAGAAVDSSLSFYLKAILINPSSAIQIREYDGADWTVLSWLPGAHNLSGETITMALNASTSQQVEIEYLKAGGDGNVVIDDVAITNITTEPTPVPPAPQPSPIYLVIAHDDYTGDGNSDVAVYEPDTGNWVINNLGTFAFGGGEYDVPVPGDYNGDGVADLAYFDRSFGLWYAQSGSGGASIYDGESWGENNDVPVPGDYDGDGTTDLAVWRPSTGYWYVKDITSIFYGYDGVIPVPGDYTGDGATDIAVLDTTTYGTWRWFVNGVAGSRAWGRTGDIAVPGVFGAAGTTDLAAYRPGTNYWWYIRRDGSGFGAISWGLPDDVPVVGDFDGDGIVDPAVFRSPDEWVIQDIGTETLAASASSAIVVGATGY